MKKKSEELKGMNGVAVVVNEIQKQLLSKFKPLSTNPSSSSITFSNHQKQSTPSPSSSFYRKSRNRKK